MAEDVSAAVEVDGQLLSRPLYQFLQQQASGVGALTARFLVTVAECCKGPLRLALLRFLRSLAHASEGVFGAVLRRLLAVARALARAASGLASLQLRLAANDDLDDAVKASARLSARLTLLYGIVRLRSQSCIQLARPTRSPGLLMPELCLSSPGSGPRTDAGSPTRRSTRPHRSLHTRADAEVHLLCSTELRAAILSFLNSAARGQQYVLLRSSGVGQSAAAAAAAGASLTATRAASAPLDAILGDCSTSMHQQELQQQQPAGQEQAMASENLCGAPGIIGCDTPCMPSDDASGSPLGCSAAGGTVTGRQQQSSARGSSSGGGGGPRLTQSLSDVYMASWLPDAATEQLLLNSAAPGPVAAAAPGEQLQQQQHAAMARGARRLSTPRNSWPAPVGGLHGPAGMVLMDGIASPRTPSQKQQAEAALRLAGCELGAGSAAGASLADVRLAPLSSFARSSVSGPLGGAGGGGGAAAASSSSASALGSWVVEATHHPQQQPARRAAPQGERSGYTPPRSASPPIAAPACRGVRKAGKRLPAAPFSLGAVAAAAGAATLPTAAPDSAASAGAGAGIQ